MRYPCLVLFAPYAHLTKRPSMLRTMPFSVQLQDRTIPFLLTSLKLARCMVLVPTWWAATPSAWRPAIELLHVRHRFDMALRKFQTARGHNSAPIFALSPVWENEFPCTFHGPLHRKCFLILFDIWTVMANLTKLRRTRSRKLPLDFSVTNCTCRISLDQSLYVLPQFLGPISRYRVADILPHLKLASNSSRPELTVGILRVLCNGLCTAQRFHTDDIKICAMLDAQIDPTPLTLQRVLPIVWLILFILGTGCGCIHGEAIFSLI